MVFKTQIIDVKILAAKAQDVVPKLFSSELVEEADLRESLEEAVKSRNLTNFSVQRLSEAILFPLT